MCNLKNHHSCSSWIRKAKWNSSCKVYIARCIKFSKLRQLVHSYIYTFIPDYIDFFLHVWYVPENILIYISAFSVYWIDSFYNKSYFLDANKNIFFSKGGWIFSQSQCHVATKNRLSICSMYRRYSFVDGIL